MTAAKTQVLPSSSSEVLNFALPDLEASKVFAENLAEALVSEQKNAKKLLLLEGPMGVGKTQFVIFLLGALGGDVPTSPSFALHNSYKTTSGFSVEHLDLFRLESADDLESTGFWDLFTQNASSVIVIEWSERLKDFGVRDQLPMSWSKIQIVFSKNDAGDERGARVTLG